MNLIVTKVNVVRYQNYMSVESDFAECRGGWREDLHRLTLYTFRHHTDNTMAHTFTTYYVTFQVESGDRMELTVSGSDYGMLVEGDIGKLSFQGTRYLGFERN